MNSTRRFPPKQGEAAGTLRFSRFSFTFSDT